eukprot:403358389
MESCMVLDNNKKIQRDVESEMNGNYKHKLDSFIKEQTGGIWLKSRMPKIKQNPSLNYRKIPAEDQEQLQVNKTAVREQPKSNMSSKLTIQLSNALNDGNIPSIQGSSRNPDTISQEREVGEAVSKIKEIKENNKPKKDRTVPNEIGNPASGKIDTKALENFKCHWTIKENEGWKPCVRSGASLVHCQHRALMFGGYNKVALQDLQYIDYRKGQWFNIPVTKGKRPVERFGHTTLFYKGNMILFGGEQKYNPEIRIRETFNDIWAYNVQDNEFKSINIVNKLACEARKDHSAALVGNHMFIYGGINCRGVMIDDPIVFNFQNNEWLTLQFKGPSPGPLIFHQACSVFKKDRKIIPGFNMLRQPDISAPQTEQKIKIEGVYFFGGKNTSGFPQNTLSVLKCGKLPLEWKEIRTLGKMPPPRYNHSMNYSEEQNLLVVYGGRCDFAAKKTNYQQILDDVWVFFLENLTWYQVICTGSIPRERFSHCACIVGTQLLIFGGLNGENFLYPELYCLELDTYHSKRVRAEDKMKARNTLINIDYGSFKGNRQTKQLGITSGNISD